MLQFVRETSIPIRIHKTLSHRRGFLFHVAAGFTGPVDELSGMVVNLTDVDQWLKKVHSHLSGQEFSLSENSESLNALFADIFNQARQILDVEAAKNQVQLSSLKFSEERGFGFGSYLLPVKSGHGLEFFNTHHLELVSPMAAGGLSKLTLFWQHVVGSEDDYAHESFKLLKPLMQRRAEELLEGLQAIKGQVLPSGSHLARIEVKDLENQLTLEI